MSAFAGTVRQWQFASAIAIGSAHLQKGLGCDDACKVTCIADGSNEWIALAVCDGAGSAQYGATGAEQVTSLYIDWVQSTFFSAEWQAQLVAQNDNWWREQLVGWIQMVHDRLDQLALNHSSNRRAFACTSIVALISPTTIYVGQIGDGALVYRDEHAAWSVAIWPMQGEYANTTAFITDDQAVHLLETRMINGSAHGVVAFTDGLQRMALQWQQREAFAGFFEPLYQSLQRLSDQEIVHWANQLQKWLESPAIHARTDDDKTMVWVVKT